MEMRSTVLVVSILITVAFFYTMMSGLWGVVVTDFLQYVVSFGGAIVLTVLAVMNIGGIDALKDKLVSLPHTLPETVGFNYLDFSPSLGTAGIPVTTFIIFIAVTWWANRVADGSGWIAQRVISTKNDRHAFGALMWGNFLDWVSRMWPYIIVGLVAVVMFPAVDPELGYPKVMMAVLPVGLRGLMVAAFFAAFMSTIDSLLNLSASYLVSDVYMRFIRRDKSQKHYVRISRLAIFLLALLAGYCATIIESIGWAWKFSIEFTAGMGMVTIIRWFWWRVNAWSEISALIASSIISTYLQFFSPLAGADNYFAHRILINVVFTGIVWIIVTYLTKPESESTLVRFYRKVRPPLRFWKPVAVKSSDVVPSESLSALIFRWIVCFTGIYTLVFGSGKLILAELTSGIPLVIIGCFCVYYLVRRI